MTHITISNGSKSGPIEKEVVRAFSAQLANSKKDGTLVLLGQAHDEHDLWFLDGKTAALVGVLTEEAFKKQRRVKQLDLVCDGSNFEHLESEFSNQRFTGRVMALTPLPEYSLSQT